MSLTIDVGNSRIKWAEWQAGKIVSRGADVYDKANLSATLDVLFTNVKRPSVVYSVCVASTETRHALTLWVRQHWQLEVDYLAVDKMFNSITHGCVINGYADPSQHGADRWATIVAAQNLYPKTPLCVIGAGTAITIDFLTHDGRHLGGYILPSYVSMRSALLSDTANVSVMSDDLNGNSLDVASLLTDNDSVPDNTNDAVALGLHRLLQAGVVDLYLQAKHILGESVQVIISGGFAKVILSYPDSPKMHHVPDLVMHGLYLIKTTKP